MESTDLVLLDVCISLAVQTSSALKIAINVLLCNLP